MSGIDQSIGLDKDCDKFAWAQIRMSFPNFHEVQLTSCFQPWIHDSTVVSNQQTLLIFTFINFSKPPQNKGKKITHTIFSSGQKFHLQLVIGQMLISKL